MTSISALTPPPPLTPVRSVPADTVPEWWPIALLGVAAQHLSRDRCLELLASRDTGRLFVLGSPAHSVTIGYRKGLDVLVIVPPPAAVDVSATHHPLVLLCVDHLEDDHQHGWSLAVAGPLLPPDDARHGQPFIDHGTFLLDLHSLTGRRVTASPARPRPAAHRR